MEGELIPALRVWICSECGKTIRCEVRGVLIWCKECSVRKGDCKVKDNHTPVSDICASCWANRKTQECVR